MILQRGVFFDLDGTIIDLNPEPLELEQLRTVVLQIASSAGLSHKTRSIFGAYQQLLIERGPQSGSAASVRKALDSYEVAWAKTRSVVKFDERCFYKLRSDCCVVGIVTNNGADCLRTLFNVAKLKAEWFDVIVTRDDVPLLKPSPVPLELATHRARQQFVALEKVWFLGDSENDRVAAGAFKSSNELELNFVGVGEHFLKSNYNVTYTSVSDFVDDFVSQKH
jgi:phosphoglycolate phosphatase-like HAD superfamily hydrolase